MSIIRVQKNSNYSVISNVHLQDEDLSWKAKGILSYLLSKPDSWQVYISHLKNQSTDGRDATASGIRELIEAGYITRDYTRNEAGQIIGRNYAVFEAVLEKKSQEKPLNKDDNPKTENPLTDNPFSDNPSLLNTDNINNGLKENNDDVPAPRTDQIQQQAQQQQSSSSFFESEMISILAGLMSLIPEKFQKPAVENTLSKALKLHSEDYVKLAVLYSIAHSNGNTVQSFRAYLGKTIDNGWADGWEPDTDETSRMDFEAVKTKFRQIPDAMLKPLADAGNQFAIEELKRRVK